jgi:hypothetical protein
LSEGIDRFAVYVEDSLSSQGRDGGLMCSGAKDSEDCDAEIDEIGEKEEDVDHETD